MSKKPSISDVEIYLETLGWKLLEETYRDNKTKLKCICPNGHIQYKTYSSFKSGDGCLECRNNSLRLEQDYVAGFIESFGYKLKSNYTASSQYLDLECDNGHFYRDTFNHFKIRESRCPYCYTSKGENRISRFLQTINIEYKTQKTFPDCKYKSLLKFDFYLKEYNLIIEYHGEQHYKWIKYFGDKSVFTEQKKKDKIKEKYCLDKHICLLIIPYWDFDNIDYILQNILL